MPIYPRRIQTYSYSKWNPEKDFPPRILEYYYEPVYEGDKLKIGFSMCNGSGSHVEWVPCEEYFPKITIDETSGKDNLVDSVVVLNNKKNYYNKQIEEIKKKIQIFEFYNNEFEILSENELVKKAKELDEENDKLKKEFEQFEELLKKYKKMPENFFYFQET